VSAVWFGFFALVWLPFVGAAPKSPPPLTSTDVRFLASDSISIGGHWYQGAIDTVALVVSPRATGGEQGRQKAIAAFHDLGYSVLTFDYRDYDVSSRAPSDSVAGLVYASRWVNDMAGALGYARSRVGANGRVFAWGQDIGGPVAVAAAAEGRDVCDAVVTEGMFRTTAEYLSRLGTAVSYDVHALHRRLVQPGDEPISACGRLTAPLYIVMAGRDSLTPNELTKDLYRGRRSRTDILLVPNAGHDNAADDPTYFVSIGRWLKQWQYAPRGGRRPRG
jgi:pimeloyl-ACP methyl ester carboxylesterase